MQLLSHLINTPFSFIRLEESTKPLRPLRTLFAYMYSICLYRTGVQDDQDNMGDTVWLRSTVSQFSYQVVHLARLAAHFRWPSLAKSRELLQGLGLRSIPNALNKYIYTYHPYHTCIRQYDPDLLLDLRTDQPVNWWPSTNHSHLWYVPNDGTKTFEHNTPFSLSRF